MEFPIPYLSESVAPISILSPLSFSPLRQSYQIVLVVSRTAAGRLSHLSASRTPKSAFATMDDMVSTTICAAALQQPSSPAKISYSARRVYCALCSVLVPHLHYIDASPALHILRTSVNSAIILEVWPSSVSSRSVWWLAAVASSRSSHEGTAESASTFHRPSIASN